MQKLTGTGRLVGGHPMIPSDKDYEGNPLMCKDKVTPRVEYYFAIAIPKTDTCIAELFAIQKQVAVAGFPGGQHAGDDFAWKVTDGDDPKHADKVGYPGHWIFNCKDGFLRDMWDQSGKAKILDAKQVKRGDYIRAQINIQPNGATKSNFGLFLNFDFTQFVGYGDEIVTGPNGAEILANAPAATLPAGASATPTGAAGGPAGAGGPGAGAGGPGVGAAGGPGAGATTTPNTAGASGGPGGPGAGGVQPSESFLDGPGGPGGAAEVDPNGPPSGFQMTATAGAYTYKQYMDTGKWTNEVLISKGMMVADEVLVIGDDVPF